MEHKRQIQRLSRVRGQFYATHQVTESRRVAAVLTKRIRARVEFLAIGEAIIPEQKNHFFVADLSGKLVDVVTGVDELALVADNVAQSRRVRDDALQTACRHL